jgi:hypothetical protein
MKILIINMAHITFKVPNLNINDLVIGFCSCMGFVIRRAVVWQSKNFEKMIKMETMAIKMSDNVITDFAFGNSQ